MNENRQNPPAGQAESTELASGAEISALARELGELAQRAPDRLKDRIRALSIRSQAELALRLPAKLRLELMLHAPKPMRLVRALPDSELYLTVREVGPEDALPLVALSSPGQLQHLFDLESWRKSEFDPKRAGGWLALLIEAGEPTIRRFVRAADHELLALLFQRWARASAVDFEEEGGIEVHSVHRAESGDDRGLSSPDGAYRFSPVIPEHAAAVNAFARLLYLTEPERYRQAIWDSLYELPAELEEQAYRWRQSRLEEHGFPPWEEALSVFAPPAGVRVRPAPPVPTDGDGLPAPRTPLRVLPHDQPLAAALANLPVADRDRVFHELVSVASRLMVAGSVDTGDPEAYKASLVTAGGYLNVAVEARKADDENAVSTLLQEIPLIELFREGYALAAALQRSARALIDEGWASAGPRALELLDAPVRDRILRLLDKRPHYLELLPDGRAAARPFRRLAEIEETRVALELAELVGRVIVDRLGLDVEDALGEPPEDETHSPRMSTYLLTLLAWHSTRSELRGDPLPKPVVADFLRTVASRRTAAPDAPERAVGALLARLNSAFNMTPRETALLHSFGKASLERLSAECGALDPGIPLDRREVGCLLIEGED